MARNIFSVQLAPPPPPAPPTPGEGSGSGVIGHGQSLWRGVSPVGMVFIMLGIFIVLTLTALLLSRSRKASAYFTWFLALALLIFNAVYFIVNRDSRGWYPVEFSHISYFVLGVTVVMGCKRLMALGGYCAMLTGLGYVLAGVVSPASLLTTSYDAVELTISVIRHELMWMCGFMVFFNVGRFRMKDVWMSLLGVFLMVGFSMLVRFKLIYPGFDDYEREHMQIWVIVTGSILEYVTGPLPFAARVISALIIGAAVIGTVVGYYYANVRLNAAREKKRIKIGARRDETAIGVLPFLAKVVKYGRSSKSSAREGALSQEYNCQKL